MATIEQTRRRIVEILDDNDIYDLDGRRHGYETSAEEMYAALAAPLLRAIPYHNWDYDELIEYGEIWCTNFWDWYLKSDDGYLPLPLDNGAIKGLIWQGVIRGKGIFDNSRVTYNPSTIRDLPVESGRCTDEETALLPARMEKLKQQALKIVETLPGLAKTNPITASFGTERCWISVQFENGAHEEIHMEKHQAIHDSNAKLLAELKTLKRRIATGIKNYQGIAKRQSTVDQILDALEATIDLPARFRFEPTLQKVYRGMIDVYLDGYGPTGMKSSMRVGMAKASDNIAKTLERFDKSVDYQRYLHKLYGPHPGSSAGQTWTIDEPTARRLGSDLHKAVAKLIVSGGHYSAYGITLTASKHHIQGTFALDDDISWKGNKLEARGVQLTNIIRVSCIGKPLTDIVQNEAIGSPVITSVQQRTSRKIPIVTFKVSIAKVTIDRSELSAAISKLAS